MAVMRLCRKLIESKPGRIEFLLAHGRPRQATQEILDAAQGGGRRLMAGERMVVNRHGFVALFCGLEVAVAPVRVENVLKMHYRGGNAYIRPKDRSYEVVISAGRVENGKKIRFRIQPTALKWGNKVRRYLKHAPSSHCDGQSHCSGRIMRSSKPSRRM